MKKLKVKWLDESPDVDGAPLIASMVMDLKSRINLLGATLVFQDPKGEEIILAIPDVRLISVIAVSEITL
jgi:hypothetical protein